MPWRRYCWGSEDEVVSCIVGEGLQGGESSGSKHGIQPCDAICAWELSFAVCLGLGSHV